MTGAPTEAARSSRRLWLQGALGAALVPLGAWWGALARWRGAGKAPEILTLPRPTTDGVQLHGEVILVRAGQAVRALSARCPHLGCRIQRVESDGAGRPALVCPCHGSRFDLDGRRLGGPARADLRPLAVEPDARPETVRVVASR